MNIYEHKMNGEKDENSNVVLSISFFHKENL